MADPVITEHGKVFDRRWIQAVIAGEASTCPLTRKPFLNKSLRSDAALKAEIQADPVARLEAAQAALTLLPGGANRQHRRPPFDASGLAPSALRNGADASPSQNVRQRQPEIDRFESVAPRPSEPHRSVAVGSSTSGWHRALPPAYHGATNVAGRAHAKLSRHNLRLRLAEMRERAHAIDLELQTRGGSDDDTVRTRIDLAGRIASCEILLRWADAASPVTRTADFLLGIHTDNGGGATLTRRGAVAGGLSLLTRGETSAAVSEPLSLLGAGLKGTVRLVAMGPSMMARRRARRAMRAQLGDS